MPKYRNDTTAVVEFNKKTWNPGDEFEVTFFVPDELGLTKTADAPEVKSPMLAAGTVTLDQTDPEFNLYVPDCEAFSSTLICESGEGYARENYAANPVKIPVKKTITMNFRSKRADIERLFVGAEVDGTKIVYTISRLS
jgi:hypothetical protein